MSILEENVVIWSEGITDMIRRRTVRMERGVSNLDIKQQCDLFIDIVSRIALEDLVVARGLDVGLLLTDVISNEVGSSHDT